MKSLSIRHPESRSTQIGTKAAGLRLRKRSLAVNVSQHPNRPMHKRIFSLLLPAIVLCCSVDVAIACTCMQTPSPCASFKDTPVVFVGVVTSIEETKVEIIHFGEKQTVRTSLLAHFTVEEPLKGI